MRKVLAIVIIVLIVLMTAFITYRVTMKNISVEVCGNVTYLTVFGQTDVYNT